MSISQYSTEDLTLGDDSDFSSDSSNSPNLTFSFEDWHAPFNHHTSCEIELDEEGSQILFIPSSSPFYRQPATPLFKSTFDHDDTPETDYSYPSVCPTLSSKFDLLHSRSPLSCSAFSGSVIAAPDEAVMIVDASEDGFPIGHGIHVVRENLVDFKVIPDFPEDAGLHSMHVF
jgi:hypothetical protein